MVVVGTGLEQYDRANKKEENNNAGLLVVDLRITDRYGTGNMYSSIVWCCYEIYKRKELVLVG
jgi:hypothetical protein